VVGPPQASPKRGLLPVADTATVKQFVRSYAQYAALLGALGHEVNEAKVLARVARGLRDRRRLAGLLAAYRAGNLNGELLDAGIQAQMDGLCEGLAEMIRQGATHLAAEGIAEDKGGLAGFLSSLPTDQRDALADLVVLDGHRGMVRPRHISVEEFQDLLKRFAGDQTVARKKLIAYIRAEFLKRGIDMSCETIQERFRPAPAVRTMPYCVKQVFRGLSDEFRTGLVPIQQLVGDQKPDDWLEGARRRLGFRSHSAMHKAIAQATGISYDGIHKALSGKKKAQRVQVQIKECLDRWLAQAEHGETVDAPDEHRGVPVEKMSALLPVLEERFRTKEDIYRAISDRTGVRTASIRRYFQDDGQLKFAPPAVFRVAEQLSREVPELAAAPVAAPKHCRRRRPASTEDVAEKAKSAFKRWQHDRENLELERDFKDMRRALIAQLQERRHRTSASRT